MLKKQTTFTIDEILEDRFNSNNNPMYLLHEVALGTSIVNNQINLNDTGIIQVNYENREGLTGCVEAFNIADLITEKIANNLGDEISYDVLLYKGWYFLIYELYIDDEHIQTSARNINGMTPQYSLITQQTGVGRYLFFTLLADNIRFNAQKTKRLPR